MHASRRPRVVVLRGHQTNPWELRPWQELGDRYDVAYLSSQRSWFDTSGVTLSAVPARTLRGLLPAGRLGDLATRVPGDRYLGLREHLEGADVVHAQELGYWYSMQAAKLKRRLGYKLVLTVWETIPFLDAYRNVRTRPYRRTVLEAADLFLAASERARDALLLEGAPAERIRVSPPGIDIERFRPPDAPRPRPDEPLILSPGRLVWEKGHQDVLRAVAALRRGVVAGPSGDPLRPRVLIVGDGPERERLERYAAQLGIADAVELRSFVPYDEMPALYARASCLVLASLPIWSWEEQFGMVIAEAMAAELPLVLSSSGAIPEVGGDVADYVVPGDWVGLAETLARGPLGGAPPRTGLRERAARFSTAAAAARLAQAYDELLADRTSPRGFDGHGA
jgi:glycosyltransferase involved in cell wall biosynthesis